MTKRDEGLKAEMEKRDGEIKRLREMVEELRKGPEFIDLKVHVWDKVSTAIMLGEISSQSDMDKLLNKIEGELKKPYMKAIREQGPNDFLKRQISLVEDAVNDFRKQDFEELREKLERGQAISV